MKRYLLPLAVLLISCAILLSVVGLTYHDLPARVASHFGADGRANGWMSREGEVEFTVAFGLGLPIFIVGLMALTSRLPARFINIPHREYWLAPERREETAAVMAGAGIWLGAMMALFMTGVHWLVVLSNEAGGEQLNMTGFAAVTFGFLAGVVVWSLVLVRQFRRPQ